MSNPEEILIDHVAAIHGMDWEGVLTEGERAFCTRKASLLLNALYVDGWRITRTDDEAHTVEEWTP